MDINFLVKKIAFRKRLHSKSGFTLTELSVAIAILGTLAVVAVPSLGHYTDLAKDSVNKVNAKTLTEIAQIIEIQTGNLPDWPASFSSMGPGQAEDLITENVMFQGTGYFHYNRKNGVVTLE